MKFGLVLVATLLFGAFAAHFLVDANGYVLIHVAGYRFETSVPIFVFLLMLLYGLVRLLISVLRLPRRVKRSYSRQRRHRANRLFGRGLVELAEGNWARGERLLARSADNSEIPLLGYLGAARAAQLQGAHDRRDNWLKLAYEQNPEATKAVLFTQAELQIAHQQYEQALATLKKAQEESPDHAQSLVLLVRIYRQLQDWKALEQLLPKLRKRKALSREKFSALACEVYLQRFAKLGSEQALKDTVKQWKAIPSAARQNPDLVIAYVRALSQSGDAALAESVLRRQLKKNWNPKLVRLYGEIDSGDPAKQLVRAESWLAQHADSSDLHLALAELCVRNELWGKARNYLEVGLEQSPSMDAYQLYGGLLERLSEHEKARQAYRDGLALAVNQTATGH